MSEGSYTDSFASIYDDVMGNVPYDLWYSYVKDLLDHYDQGPEQVIDLACGTGNMTFRFAENESWKVSGVDMSEEMLEMARGKAEQNELNVDFYQADLRTFSPDDEFDLAVSLFDSLNYILNYEELKKVFLNVYNLLNDRGIFIFDMNTIERLMSIEPGTLLLNGDNYSCFWKDIIDKENKIWQVDLKIYFDNDRINFSREVHQETSYPIQDILAGLKWAGFKEIDVFKAYTFKRGKDSDNRVYFVAGKDFSQRKNRFLSLIGKTMKWQFINIFFI